MWGFWQMRLRNETTRARLTPAFLALALAAALSGCGMFDGDAESVSYAEQSDFREEPRRDEARYDDFDRDDDRSRDRDRDRPQAVAQTGPAADYPVVIGNPFTVDGVLYTPADTLNYDEVGYAALDRGGGSAVSAAHRTLPLPSYVEVTSLDTGRTILVRVERRGPMNGSALIALSPGAATQLGGNSGTPVRVRRVNPPEPERAALRMGGRATDRLETPETLLTVLRRKLPGEAPPVVADAGGYDSGYEELPPAYAPQPAPRGNAYGSETATLALPPLPPLAGASAPAPNWQAPTYSPPPQQPQARPAPRPVPSYAAAPAPRVAAPAPAPASARGAFVVQAGAFSTRDRAQRVANVVGGSVSSANGLFRVRTGPFATRGQAEASLAKVRAAGYSEARIFTNG